MKSYKSSVKGHPVHATRRVTFTLNMNQSQVRASLASEQHIEDWKMLQINKGQKRKRERKTVLFKLYQTQQIKSATETKKKLPRTENTEKDDRKERNKAT